MISTNSKMIFRWIALPFAAFIGALAGSILLGAFQWLSLKMYGGMSEDGWYFTYLLPFFSSIAFGYLFTIISLQVAPESKVIATTVMVTLLGVMNLIILFLGWKMQISDDFGYFIKLILAIVGTMVAAISALVNHKEYI